MGIEELFVREEDTVVQCMKQLGSTAKQILFVIDNGVLKASLTDGDIRRWILSNGDLNASISKVANYNPLYVYEKDKHRAWEIIAKYQIKALPVVSDRMGVVDIIMKDIHFHCESSEALAKVPVVIMAGGLGTRLYPFTKILPKALVPVKDIPITELIMNEFSRFGCNNIYMIVNHKKGMIKSYYWEANLPYQINFIDEEEFLGTGGGLGLLKEHINTTFILTNCDILIKCNYADVINEHKKHNNMITMVCSVKEFVIPYGIVDVGDNGQIDEIREKPSMSFLTNTGLYIVEPEVIDYINENEAIGFPDIVKRVKDNGQRVGLYPISEDSWYDMGQIEELHRMEEML